MQSNAARALVVLAAVAVVVVGFIVLRGDDESDGGSDAGTTTSEQVSTDGSSTGGTQSAKEKKGSGGGGGSTGPEVTEIVVAGGEPKGGVAELEYSKGEEVQFAVSSDAADEIHVHGYDIYEDIPGGGEAKVSFPADIEGVFEIELHGSGALLAELTVNP